jgi:predicted amidohydrolase
VLREEGALFPRRLGQVKPFRLAQPLALDARQHAETVPRGQAHRAPAPGVRGYDTAMSGPPPLRVAVVQDLTPENLDEGLARTRELTAHAAWDGAQLVAFPETWLPGYPAWLDVCRDVGLWDHPPFKRAFAALHAASIAVPGPACDELARTAAALQVVLVVGVVERVENGPGRGTLYNSLLFFGPDGRLLNHHRKLVPTFTERLVWGPGDAEGLRAVHTPAGRVGGLVCWEHWMPLARQALHQDGEQVHVAAWPGVREMHLVASRQYAFEGRCFVLAAGSLLPMTAVPAGLELHPDRVPPATDAGVAGGSAGGGWLLRGGSAIIGPDGAVLAGPVMDRAEILRADLELDRCVEESATLDVTGHYHRPELLRMEVVRTGSRPVERPAPTPPSVPSAPLAPSAPSAASGHSSARASRS